MVRCALGLVATLLAAGACDNGKMHLHPEAGRDAPPPPWWRPELGTAKDWDIQLVDPIDVSMTRTMYLLDLWSLVPSSRTIDYGDAAPVTVPMGSNPGTIAELKGRGVKVICHVNTGVLDASDPDAAKYPAASIGNQVDPADPDLKYLDIRAGTRAQWTKYMFKRFDLAKDIGCDGVDAAFNDTSGSDTGFTVPAIPDQFTWYEEIAKQLHDRELSAGMHNGSTINDLVDKGADLFDWMLFERCGEYGDCDKARPFIDKRRVVFAVDYEIADDGGTNDMTLVCGKQQMAQISEGLLKDFPPSKLVRKPCQP